MRVVHAEFLMLVIMRKLQSSTVLAYSYVLFVRVSNESFNAFQLLLRSNREHMYHEICFKTVRTNNNRTSALAVHSIAFTQFARNRVLCATQYLFCGIAALKHHKSGF